MSGESTQQGCLRSPSPLPNATTSIQMDEIRTQGPTRRSPYEPSNTTVHEPNGNTPQAPAVPISTSSPRISWKTVMHLFSVIGVVLAVVFGVPAWLSYMLSRDGVNQTRLSKKLDLWGFCLDHPALPNPVDRANCEVIKKGFSVAEVSSGLFELATKRVSKLHKRATLEADIKADRLADVTVRVANWCYSYVLSIVACCVTVAFYYGGFDDVGQLKDSITRRACFFLMCLTSPVAIALARYPGWYYCRATLFLCLFVTSHAAWRGRSMLHWIFFVLCAVTSAINARLMLVGLNSTIVFWICEEVLSYLAIQAVQMASRHCSTFAGRLDLAVTSFWTKTVLLWGVLELPTDTYNLYACDGVTWTRFVVHITDCDEECNFPFSCPLRRGRNLVSDILNYLTRAFIIYALGRVEGRLVRIFMMIFMHFASLPSINTMLQTASQSILGQPKPQHQDLGAEHKVD